MKINKLSVTNLRAFKHADFEFQPGMNLLVGVNGVGKTTVLDAIRVCLSRVLPEISSAPARIKDRFELRDINIMAEKKTLYVSCDMEWVGKTFNVTQNKPEETIVEDDPGNPRAQAMETIDDPFITPTLNTLFKESKKSKAQPLAVYFSTRRSHFVDTKVTVSASAGGQAAAFADALSIARESNLRVLAEWYKTQQVLGEETPITLRHVAALRDAIKIFIPGFDNLVVVELEKGEPHFTIDKNGIPLNVRYQLSDGERGMLALVLELAKRLSQANPEMDNPLHGEGVVLIDELDLHLHPKWQRTIVENLTRTFPNLQFIATTHSPQVIPSVHPANIQLIDNGEVTLPDRSYGMDSNWVLRQLMDTDDKPEISGKAIAEIEKLVDEAEFDEAREQIEKYKNEGLDLQYWSILEGRMARLETFDDEE